MTGLFVCVCVLCCHGGLRSESPLHLERYREITNERGTGLLSCSQCVTLGYQKKKNTSRRFFFPSVLDGPERKMDVAGVPSRWLPR